MVGKSNDKRPTTNRQTTNDLKTTIGVSLPGDLIQEIRKRANGEDRNFSSMCVVLLKRGLAFPFKADV